MDNARIITGYTVSRDYERLADLARSQSIICIVDYERSMRDIARTMYRCRGDDEYWEVGARGTGYIVAFERAEFILACRAVNLEFLDPARVAAAEGGIAQTK